MYPSERWKLFFTLADCEAKGIALRVVCRTCKRKKEVQPHWFADWRRTVGGRDLTVAEAEARLKCEAGHKDASVSATESRAMIGR